MEEAPIRVTLTTFLDFVSATGPARITVVRKARQDYERGYAPARDYYRQLRLGIVEMHQSARTRRHLDDLLPTVSANKTGIYEAAINGYAQWMGRKQLHWAGAPPNGTWSVAELGVMVNPELLVTIEGSLHLIKLYFKATELSKAKVDEVLFLLQTLAPQGATVGVLDVRRAKLYTPTRDIPGMDALLLGEAAALVTMWRAV